MAIARLQHMKSKLEHSNNLFSAHDRERGLGSLSTPVILYLPKIILIAIL